MGDCPRLGDTVTLHYRLSCAGQVIIDTFGDQPDTFVLGHGEIDPRLETLILTLQPGQHRVFDLEAWQAFGLRDDALVHTLPRSDFSAECELVLGHSVDFPLPNGQVLTGTLLEAGPDNVRVDFNHPLAGLPLRFEVELLAVARASSP
jgi:FKBP-type peptidyl-prolyl cis-trans isomerase SlpA